MAIDSTLFAVDLPAGTYSVGDEVQLTNIAGPAIVRSGRGSALLKRITTGILGSVSGSVTYWEISVKNDDWVDPSINFSAPLMSSPSLDSHSGLVTYGNDAPLTANSGWTVTAKCIGGGTTTIANSVFALIDIDYPSVSSITNPDTLVGYPSTVDYYKASAKFNALGTLTTSNFVTENVDVFKAGFEYALQEVATIPDGTAGMGFIALANAANMGGLQRIVPVNTSVESIKNTIEYATKLVKGPMDIKLLMFTNSGSSGTYNTHVLLDFVKRKV